MGYFFKTLMLITFTVHSGILKAQENKKFNTKSIIDKNNIEHAEDSLLRIIDNNIYYSYYSPSYMSNKTPIFTMLKIDLDWNGKVTGIHFSDSADSVFVKSYFNNPRNRDIKSTFEKYARLKAYSNISLLIPVNYQPEYPNQKKIFSYEELERSLKFKNQYFIGNSVMFSPINIKVLTKGNM
ncbi:hypothetical protein [Mucilaginibacter sp. AK015]|uniref:hypothetical protein n=1 Tax=Mucilaginibacter sp. AK015 TaxID=2723072 RepID=UPI00161B4484|nr:hypothetical protein [Mucilaginibacter sp. AK015]MBB5396353.1 hypothetical protein [Mucilaginibacter sp. AK015]